MSGWGLSRGILLFFFFCSALTHRILKYLRLQVQGEVGSVKQQSHKPKEGNGHGHQWSSRKKGQEAHRWFLDITVWKKIYENTRLLWAHFRVSVNGFDAYWIFWTVYWYENDQKKLKYFSFTVLCYTVTSILLGCKMPMYYSSRRGIYDLFWML